MSASFVLGSSKSSTYPRGYASGFDSPATLLTNILSILWDVFLWCATIACSKLDNGMGYR